MPSPLPGMDLFLEQSAFWASFHSRFIVALADAIEAGLTPAYYVEVEARTYLDEGHDGLLIGIPEAVVATGGSGTTPPHANTRSVAVQVRPQSVQVPLPRLQPTAPASGPDPSGSSLAARAIKRPCSLIVNWPKVDWSKVQKLALAPGPSALYTEPA